MASISKLLSSPIASSLISFPLIPAEPARLLQELLESNPEAVGKRFGYYTVDYNKIDVNFERIDGR